MTKVTYDDEAYAIYIYLQEPYPGITKRTVYLDHGMHLDLDKDDKPVGFELILEDYDEEGIEILKKHFDIRRQPQPET